MVLASLNLLSSLRTASPIELAVLLLLGVASTYSWALIAMKSAQLRSARRETDAFLDVFWNSTRLDKIYEKSVSLEKSPVARVFRAGYEELTKLANKNGEAEGSATRISGIENVERSLGRASMVEITNLEAHVAFLGTIGSTSPFVGLFGTVMGILGAFNQIAEKGNATIATVAGPIGSALLATAIGLFAAIPAVIAYNSYVSRVRVFDADMANFSSDFLNIVKRHFFR